MEKDFRLAIEAAAGLGADVPITRTAAGTFTQARDNGLGDKDIMSILVQLERMSAAE
jgi:3-hydroxyisobutyrate dehydrogenase-like beta-hydroxyacid dehydrogenase